MCNAIQVLNALLRLRSRSCCSSLAPLPPSSPHPTNTYTRAHTHSGRLARCSSRPQHCGYLPCYACAWRFELQALPVRALDTCSPRVFHLEWEGVSGADRQPFTKWLIRAESGFGLGSSRRMYAKSNLVLILFMFFKHPKAVQNDQDTAPFL
jgi:hypothetical protein